MALFNKADILIPDSCDLTKWSVVACDQYTSQNDYWERVKNYVGDSPSTLNLVFPEVYLDEGEKRINKINNTMNEYINGSVFKEFKNSLIYVERTLLNGNVRKGIIGSIDLEEYDFNKGSKSKIRATEGTVIERIPPRVKIRENASLELPHVMLLVNDENCTLLEKVKKGESIYDFDLMENGGHLKGYLIDESESDAFINRLDDFSKTAPDQLVFAVGDGNHSLATAKTCWENIKKNLSDEEIKKHPARFCLVEIENIHDASLIFEPIHRVVFDVEPEKIVNELFSYYDGTSFDNNGGQEIKFVYKNIEKSIFINNSPSNLAVGTLQRFLDSFNCKIDYIHGEDVVKMLSQKDNTIGFLLPKPNKSELFASVIKDGALPRKTFSMGEANEKRFYMEAKRIK